MRQHRHKSLLTIAIVCVLMYAFLFGTTIVFADEPAPLSVSTEEETSPPADELADAPEDDASQLPVEEPVDQSESGEQVPVAEELDDSQLPADTLEETPPVSPDELSPTTDASVEPDGQLPDTESEMAGEPTSVPSEEAEFPDQLPTDTQIVVLVDDQVEPLATQAAAEALVYGDPMWCPEGVTPGNVPSGDCTDPFGSFNTVGGVKGLLVADATNKDLRDVTGTGTIYVENGAVADTSPIVINGNIFTGLQTYELTIQGGWDFSTDTLSGTPSIFSSRLQVVNWQNNVTIKDISVSNTTSHGITVTTTGDINLDNVTSSNNSSGHGAVLNNTAGASGNIKVTGNSNFSNNNHSGLIANSNGTITLQNVIARKNGENGASLNNSGGSSGTITLNGANVFNENTLNGLWAVSKNDITSDTSLTANNNGNYGAFFKTTSGTGSVTLQGINTFNNNYLTGLNVRAGGSISLENVTASDNSQTGNTNTNTGNGVYLYNRGGGGSITISGTSIFNHNYAAGLVAYSDGDITLSNVTAGADAATGNGTFGALLNNSTGTGNVALSGTNIFNNNSLDGLRVVSTGNIITSGNLAANDNSRNGAFLSNNTGAGHIFLAGTLTLNGNTEDGLRAVSNADINVAANLAANNNGRYGAFLNNSMGTGNVAFTGTSNFNGNTLDGLRVSSAGNITSTTSLTANGNNRYGAYLGNTAGTGYISLTGTNTFNGNKRDGLRVVSNGDVTAKNTTASTNGQHGFNIETTNGQTRLWCGYAYDNGLYGVSATKNKVLNLYGMNFGGNTLGPIYTDDGIVYYGDCCLEACKTKACGDKSINIVSVANTRGPVELNCQLFAGTKLILPNGDFVYIPCSIGDAATLKALAETSLPGTLPPGSGFGSGFTLDVMAEEQGIEQVDGMMTISFVIPAGMSADTLSILFWNGSEWIEVDNANQVGNRFEAQVDYTGTFILVSK